MINYSVSKNDIKSCRLNHFSVVIWYLKFFKVFKHYLDSYSLVLLFLWSIFYFRKQFLRFYNGRFVFGKLLTFNQFNLVSNKISVSYLFCIFKTVATILFFCQFKSPTVHQTVQSCRKMHVFLFKLI